MGARCNISDTCHCWLDARQSASESCRWRLDIRSNSDGSCYRHRPLAFHNARRSLRPWLDTGRDDFGRRDGLAICWILMDCAGLIGAGTRGGEIFAGVLVGGISATERAVSGIAIDAIAATGRAVRGVELTGAIVFAGGSAPGGIVPALRDDTPVVLLSWISFSFTIMSSISLSKWTKFGPLKFKLMILRRSALSIVKQSRDALSFWKSEMNA